MRGSDERTGELFSYVDIEERVPRNYPLRLIRRIVNEVLAALDGEFAKLYAEDGRPSIAPERLLRALLLQAFYTIRSERQLMEQLQYNLLYRWFVGLGVDDPVWVPTVFSKNRDRLLGAEVARKFLAELLTHKEVRALLSDEHFSVDGTQVQAWASMKSFVAKDGSGEPPSPGCNGERDFHGEKRSNETHASTTEPEAKLYKKGKGKEAKLSYIGNVMTENRNGFVVEAELLPVSGTVEREDGQGHDRASFAGRAAHHRRRRQGLRHRRLRRRHARVQRDAAHRAKHDRPPLRHRRAHHPPFRLRDQPAGSASASRSRSARARPSAGCVAHAARRQKARLQVHLDDGRLRSHQTAKTDRSGCLMDRETRQSPSPACPAFEEGASITSNTGKHRSST